MFEGSIVVMRVPRSRVPQAVRALHLTMGIDLRRRGPATTVYLPAGPESFGLVRGGVGVMANVGATGNAVSTDWGAYNRFSVVLLGNYWGWMFQGVRVEVVTEDGQFYDITVSYAAPDVGNHAWKLNVLEWMVYYRPHSTLLRARALTPQAAERFPSLRGKRRLPRTNG